MEARVLVGLGNLGTSKLLCYAGKWIYTFQLLMVIQGINGAINPQAAAAAAAMNPQAAALYQQRLQAQSTPTSTAPPTPGAPPNLSAFIRPPRPVLIISSAFISVFLSNKYQPLTVAKFHHSFSHN